MLNKKLVLVALIAALSSCSANKKSSGESTAPKQNEKATTEIKKLSGGKKTGIEADDMFSVSAAEIKKSGSTPYVVYFDTNSAKLDEKALEVLNNKILPEAKDAKAKKVVIEAHCDERGSTAYNQKLSQKRANAVKNHLINSGISNLKIKAIGYGKSKPVALGHDEASWSQNRRAITIVIKK